MDRAPEKEEIESPRVMKVKKGKRIKAAKFDDEGPSVIATWDSL